MTTHNSQQTLLSTPTPATKLESRQVRYVDNVAVTCLVRLWRHAKSYNLLLPARPGCASGGGCFWLAVALPADRARLHLRQKAEVWLKDLPSAAWCAFDVLYYWQIFRLVESFVVSLWPLFGD